MMLRRMIYHAKAQAGDTSLKVLAGKAAGLLETLGLQGSALREDEALLPEQMENSNDSPK